MPTVADTGESSLIARIRERAGAPGTDVRIGIGDDAAVVEPVRGRSDVITTDTLVEDVHFARAWTPARSIGRKAVLVNLSDLAAMGATPRAILLSLCLPPALPLSDFDALVDGVVSECETARAALAGGNITASPGPLVVGVTAIGAVHPRRVLTRSGAHAGDELYLTGTIGAASAGLEILQAGAGDRDSAERACVERYQTPPQRVACARSVAGNRAARACVDLSDGLADAVRQLATASQVGATIDAGALPIDPAARAWWTSAGMDAIDRSLTGGEDYELLFAVPPRRRRALLAACKAARVPVTRVGQVTATGELTIAQGEDRKSLPPGFAHFASK